MLYQILQKQIQNVINVMHLIQQWKKNGWDMLITRVTFFFEKYGIKISDLNKFQQQNLNKLILFVNR